jgi:apolipoprotein N-acyltransferase
LPANFQVLRYTSLLLSILSGLLLWFSWPVSPFTFLIFVAFVPLILIAARVKRGLSFFGWSYLTLLIWNIGATWWICHSTIPGGVAAIVANSLLMCLPWIAFFHVRNRLGDTAGYVGLLAFWTTFEYIHLNWELSWPWLTVGNVFAARPNWIQWYEYTGSSGGTVWVMLVNIFIAMAITRYYKNRSLAFAKQPLIAAVITVFLPVVISYLILNSAQEKYQARINTGSNIVVVQPNIDPYMKFESGMQEGQLQTLISLSESKIDSATTLLVWPETALNLPTGIDLDRVNEQPFLTPLWNMMKSHPQLTLLTGIEGIRYFPEGKQGEFSRAIPNSGYYYETYNAATIVTDTGVSQFYNKSKLVPGVETLPSFLRVISGWFEEFGGTGSGYTMQAERTVLTDKRNIYKIAPAICYESIFGEFLTAYVRNGANLICIITNDGWWANTSGHKQHMQYARLRAIETRRWIARSANTGISAFVSPVGEIVEPEGWDKAAAIRLNVPPIEDVVFFARHGDILSRFCIVVAAAMLLWSLVLWFKTKFYNRQANAEKTFPAGR